jgi:hypothetical protein
MKVDTINPDKQLKSPKGNSVPDRFSFSTMFKGSLSDDKFENDLSYLASDSRMPDEYKDSFVETIFELVEELFEIRDMKWFRRNLILLVQFAFDVKIKNKIRQSIYSLISEDMLVHYLNQIRDSFWRLDQETTVFELIKYSDNQLDESILNEIREKVKYKLIESIPGNSMINLF